MRHYTTIDLKLKHFAEFTNLIKNQLEYGGKKYAQDDVKESTDIIAEVFTDNWTFGTIFKYLLRFRNLKREKDLLKIVAYCYIIWLQNGFHLNDEHDEDVNNEI